MQQPHLQLLLLLLALLLPLRLLRIVLAHAVILDQSW
jgi:hypothetical protein